jgi:hypothetical protein
MDALSAAMWVAERVDDVDADLVVLAHAPDWRRWPAARFRVVADRLHTYGGAVAARVRADHRPTPGVPPRGAPALTPGPHRPETVAAHAAALIPPGVPVAPVGDMDDGVALMVAAGLADWVRV